MLSDRALAGLKSYKYKATGYTLLDDLHQAPWNYIVNRLPLWLAPNLITLTGTLLVLMAYILNTIYLPGFQGEAPSWLYWFTAASVVLYVNLDCMDGKQARRTGTSSPLGQLFDHGCDGLVLHMLLANIACSLGLSCGWKMAVGCLGIMAPWIVAQWEEYHTGIMVYGTRYYGVLEANYAICAVHLVNACFGARVWHLRVMLPAMTGLGLVSGVAAAATATTGAVSAAFQPPGSASMSVGDLSLVCVAVAGVVQGLESCRRVALNQRRGVSLPHDERGHKQLGAAHPWLHLSEIVLFLGLGAGWLAAAQGAGVAQCRLAFSTFGLLYALTATLVILAHMAKEPLLLSRLPLFVLGVGLVNEWYGWVDSLTAVLVLHGVALVGYVVFACCVVDQVCRFLGIRCLIITPKVTKPKSATQ